MVNKELTQAQEKTLSYVAQGKDRLEEVVANLDLPEEPSQEVTIAIREWQSAYDEVAKIIRGHMDTPYTTKDFIDKLCFQAERISDIKDTLMLIIGRIDAGEV